MNEYSYFPATCYLQPSILESFFFSYQITFSYSFGPLLSTLWLPPSFSVVLLGILLFLENPSVLQGFLSRGIFQSLIWMVFFLLLYVFCHFIEILQWLVIPSSYLVDNWHNVLRTFLLLGWSFSFDHSFESDMLLTTIL